MKAPQERGEEKEEEGGASGDVGVQEAEEAEEASSVRSAETPPLRRRVPQGGARRGGHPSRNSWRRPGGMLGDSQHVWMCKHGISSDEYCMFPPQSCSTHVEEWDVGCMFKTACNAEGGRVHFQRYSKAGVWTIELVVGTRGVNVCV